MENTKEDFICPNCNYCSHCKRSDAPVATPNPVYQPGVSCYLCLQCWQYHLIGYVCDAQPIVNPNINPVYPTTTFIPAKPITWSAGNPPPTHTIGITVGEDGMMYGTAGHTSCNVGGCAVCKTSNNGWKD